MIVALENFSDLSTGEARFFRICDMNRRDDIGLECIREIPLREFGFWSYRAFLNCFPDTVKIRVCIRLNEGLGVVIHFDHFHFESEQTGEYHQTAERIVCTVPSLLTLVYTDVEQCG